jgi:hypothetical protein
MIDDSHAISSSPHLACARCVVYSHESILDDIEDLAITLELRPWEVLRPNQDGLHDWRSKHVTHPFICCHGKFLVYLCIQPIWIDNWEIDCVSGAKGHIAAGRRCNNACNDRGILTIPGLLKEWI